MPIKPKLSQKLAAKRPLYYPDVPLNSYQPYQEEINRTATYPPYEIEDNEKLLNRPTGNVRVISEGRPEDIQVDPPYPSRLTPNTFREQTEYNLGVDTRPKEAQIQQPPATKNMLAANKDRQLKVTPGQPFTTALESESQKTKQGSSTKKVQSAGDPYAEEILKRDRDRYEKAQAQLEEAPEHYKDLSAYASREQGLQEAQRKDLLAALEEHTSRLSHNEEREFWQKLVGALGQIGAGAAGLATDSNVGGQYKAPEMFSREAADKTSQSIYDATKGNVQAGFEGQRKVDENIMKQMDALRGSAKESAQLVKAATSMKSGTTTTDYNETEQQRSTREALGLAPYPRANKDTDKDAVDTKYKTDKYRASVRKALSEINKMYSLINAQETPEQFADKFVSYVNAYAGEKDTGVAAVAANRDAIVTRYNYYKNKYNGSDTAAKEALINEFTDLANVNFTKFNTVDDALKVAQNSYGLPASLIVPTKKEGGEIFLSPEGEKAKAAKKAKKASTPASTKILIRKKGVTGAVPMEIEASAFDDAMKSKYELVKK